MGKPAWVKGHGHDEEAGSKEGAGFGPRRFWLKPESSTQIVFVDDEPIRFYEHNVAVWNAKLGRSDWRNWATCPGEGCQLCAIGDKPAYVAAWTVIDRTEFKDKKGQVHKDRVMLFVAKPKIMTILARRSAKLREKGHENGLAGMVFEVARSNAKAASTGDDFELVGKAPKLIEGVSPFDYEEILAPDERKLIRFASILRSAAEHPKEASGGHDVPWDR